MQQCSSYVSHMVRHKFNVFDKFACALVETLDSRSRATSGHFVVHKGSCWLVLARNSKARQSAQRIENCQSTWSKQEGEVWQASGWNWVSVPRLTEMYNNLYFPKHHLPTCSVHGAGQKDRTPKEENESVEWAFNLSVDIYSEILIKTSL